ncbi:MAG: S8 family serine peptidase [Crocinitomicaceae bacterium]
MNKLVLLGLGLVAINANAQELDKETKEIINWYNTDKYGMQTDKAYAKLLKDRKSQAVVVAVIDSGVDIEHEDLQGSIWVNEDEIPGNGIDDDNNGYIDDVNGWSFLGNPDGENIEHEQLEMTRLYVRYKKQFEGKTESDIADADKAAWAEYMDVKKQVESAREQAEKTIPMVSMMLEKAKAADANLKKKIGEDYTKKDLQKYLKKNPEDEDATAMIGIMAQGLSVATLERYAPYFQGQLDYHYNLEMNARTITGDNPADFSDTSYGSSDVEGPDALHGTHCAGIICATRGNGLGGDGVADNVKIMSLRAVPDGDERDKDIALAIRYAVDNGAQICSMSYGKGYSPYKEEVIAAIKYAEENGVLLVHAAGNSGMDIGENANFPSPKYPSMSSEFTNWIEVGASTRYGKYVPAKKNKDGSIKKPGTAGLAASFSNYSKEHVDIYAPGLEIYSTVPQSEYYVTQGTSMACPMVSGLAALLKSYFPDLTMFEIRDIILKSVTDVSEIETRIPGGKEVVKFGNLCETGGIANVYAAVEMAIALEASK